VLPVAGDPIADGAVLVGADGRIAAVGSDPAVPRPAAAETLELGDAAILPGLVNVHSHLELTALRGLVRNLPFVDWLRTVRAIKDALDPAAFRAAARWGTLEGLAAGITTYGDTGSTGAAAAALAELGARGVAYQEVFGPDPAGCAEAMAGLEAALVALARWRSPRVEIGVSPHAPYTVSSPLLEAVAALAAARGLKVAMHVAESRDERALVEEGGGPFAALLGARGIAVEPRARSTVDWLAGAGLLDCRPLLIHCVTADARDFATARHHGAAVALCPRSNAVLGHGCADFAAMRRSGVVVGLGTDSVAAGGRLDLFAEARLAASGAGEPALGPRGQLRLMTADGAAALGLADLGTLAPGAWGDLAAVSLAGPAFRTAAGPEAAVADGATASDVVLAVVAGRVVYRQGAWPGVDLASEAAAFATAAAAAAVSRGAPAGGMFAPS
jgi:cytosine/adenosine deaminase-related metal-dependent hydrolase